MVDTSPQYRHGASNHPLNRTLSVTKALGGEYDGIKTVDLKSREAVLLTSTAAEFLYPMLVMFAII
jgi:hypothetical protein